MIYYFFSMKTDTKKQAPTTLRKSFDQVAKDITNVFETGFQPGGFGCSEVVLFGQRVDAAYDMLRSRVNGEYSIMDALDPKFPFELPSEKRIVCVVDMRRFEIGRLATVAGAYEGTVDRITAAMHIRPGTRVLTLVEDKRYDSPFGYPLFVNADKINYDQ